MFSPNLEAPRLASGRSVDQAPFRIDIACPPEHCQMFFQDLLLSEPQRFRNGLRRSDKRPEFEQLRVQGLLLSEAAPVGRKKPFFPVRALVACFVESRLDAYLN
jgi:hypothetical protein